MHRFYVYTVKDINPLDRDCIYVNEEQVEQFAIAEFRPDRMDYSGVLIEADDAHHAHEIYNTFSDGEILWAEEPLATVAKRRAFEARTKLAKSMLKDLDKAERAAARLALNALIEGVTLNIEKINKDISYMSRLVRKLSSASPHMTPEQIYKKIKKQYVEQFKDRPYNDDSGPSSKTPW